MGQATTEARREVERTRDDLGNTIGSLRSQSGSIRQRAKRISGAGGGVIGLAAVGVGAAVWLRRRRGGVVTHAALHLPEMARGATVPAARGLDRWLLNRGKRLAQRREDLLESLSERIAENQAKAQRRANPMWRKTAMKALETLATVGVSALIRRAMAEPKNTPNSKRSKPQEESR